MKNSLAKTLRIYAILTLGAFIIAAGNHFFKFPNNFSTGGVTGMAILLSALFPNVSSSLFASVLNVVFLILGFAILNKGFGARTVYCSLLFSALLSGLEWICPLSAPLTDQPLLELLFAVILPALGSGILFNMQGSTGGTDILAMILKKFTNLDIGRALLCVDVIIAGSTLFLINIQTGLFSLLGLLLKSVLVDTVIESINRKKSVILVTSYPDEVAKFITDNLHRSATIWEAKGAYTHETKWVVMSALGRSQAVILRRWLKELDPQAFVLVTNSSEIFGKGFLRG
jgi:uncharacterized membrane-anchored protein YitT (DUF2179 family)